MEVFLKRGTPPIIVGTGLITLDVIINQQNDAGPQILAGGTCGNVLAILAFLGWDSYPVARLNDDVFASKLIADLKKWKVKTDFINLPPTVDAPIIVQKLKKNSKGESYHKFSWTCPKCGAWLPSYKPVLAQTIREISHQFPTPQVFFFDRVSRSALLQAEKFSSEGAIVFFEPSGVSDDRLFKEALGLAHVVKYAQDRGASFKDMIALARPLVEIETLGSTGLRYRTSLGFSSTRQWNFLPAFITTVSDAAGAGDWCTAGIIHSLAKEGYSSLNRISHKDFCEALRLGQVMASWTCRFEGPRGGMYKSTKKGFREFVQSGLDENGISPQKLRISPSTSVRHEVNCPVCQ